MLTPLLVLVISPATEPSTFPPLSAARSTTTEPGAIFETISAVTNLGAVRPGTAAVVINTSAAAIYGESNSFCLFARSSVISLAYPPAPSKASNSKLINFAPIDLTSSAEDGRTSYAETTAPNLLAVAIACSPATPAPKTTTFAGVTVPAAVIRSGKNFGESSAATRDAL